MPLNKLILNGEAVTFDEALEIARRGDSDLPFPFIKAVIAGITDRQATIPEGQVSVTDVIGCPRAKYLKTYEEYAEKPEAMMAAFRGTLLHQVLSKYAEEEATVETRTSRDFAGHTLHGTADSIVTTRVNGRYKLRDWKCVAPDVKVLTGDLRWIPAGSVKEGDVLLAVDEYVPSFHKQRRFRRAKVTSIEYFRAPSVRVTTERGSLVVSANHPFLVRCKTGPSKWLEASKLIPGTHRIVFVSRPWEMEDTREAGRLAGLFEGEGHYENPRVSIRQAPGPLADDIRNMLQRRGYRVYEETRLLNGPDNKPSTRWVISAHADVLRFLGSIRPSRLLEAFQAKGFTASPQGAVPILSVESVGVSAVVGLETEAATLITEGFISHNSTKRVPLYSPWSNHTQQLNLYRWLYELPAKGTDMSVIYFDLNGAEVADRAVKARDYWSDTQVEAFLNRRFVPLAEALKNKQMPLYRDVPADLLLWMCSWCVDPQTLILLADLSWKPAGLIQLGEELFGVDEFASARLPYHRYIQKASVTGVELRKAPRLQIVTNKGITVVSDKHEFLVAQRAAGHPSGWVSADRLQEGDKIKFISQPWAYNSTREAGYLAGLADGEGSYSVTREGGIVQVAQKPGIVLDEFVRFVSDAGFELMVDNVNYHGVHRARIAGGMAEQLRFLGSIRPPRFLEKFERLFWGRKSLPRGAHAADRYYAIVREIESVDVGEVIAIQTSTSTLVTDGLISHNCPVYESCYNHLLNEPGSLPIFAQAARSRKK